MAAGSNKSESSQAELDSIAQKQEDLLKQSQLLEAKKKITEKEMELKKEQERVRELEQKLKEHEEGQGLQQGNMTAEQPPIQNLSASEVEKSMKYLEQFSKNKVGVMKKTTAATEEDS